MMPISTRACDASLRPTVESIESTLRSAEDAIAPLGQPV